MSLRDRLSRLWRRVRAALGHGPTFPNGERLRTFEVHFGPGCGARLPLVLALARHATNVHRRGDDIHAQLTLDQLRAAHEDPKLEGDLTLVPVREG